MTAEGSRSPITTRESYHPAQRIPFLFRVSPVSLSRVCGCLSFSSLSLSRVSPPPLVFYTVSVSLSPSLDVSRFQISAFVGVADHAIILTIVPSATTFTSCGGWSVKPPQK